jgi:hypothetical protein
MKDDPKFFQVVDKVLTYRLTSLLLQMLKRVSLTGNAKGVALASID